MELLKQPLTRLFTLPSGLLLVAGLEFPIRNALSPPLELIDVYKQLRASVAGGPAEYEGH